MKIKYLPEDFKVDEIPIDVEYKDIGPFLHIKIKKKGVNTMDAMKRIASSMNIPVRYVNCAGNKDRNAITTQVCSLKKVKIQKVGKLQIPDIQVSPLGYSSEPVRIGMIKGNKFRIIVRDIISLPETPKKFLNLYGEQRFSKNNDKIGKLIIQRKFKEALKLIKQSGHHEVIRQRLEEKPHDFIGALKTLPLNHIRLYVHAYQSKVWNECAKQTNEEKLPVVGYDTEKIPECAARIMEKDGINQRQFLFREWPEISAEGSEREVFILPEVKISKIEEDDVHPGKQKCTVEFELGPGSYATEIIRQLFLQDVAD